MKISNAIRKLIVAVIFLAIGVLLTAYTAHAQEGPRNGGQRPPLDDRMRPRPGGPQQYSLAQAVSDEAQLHTIAFSGLAFITGDFSADTFIPPGKVCDFFGFQYMRDIDTTGTGHNPKFLDRVAANVLSIMTDRQRAAFEDLAREQAPQLNALAMKRLPVIKAFCRQLGGDIPPGSTGLNREAVMQAVGEIFAQDALLSYRRAQVCGKIAASFTPEQKAYLARMRFGDFASWPDVDMEPYKLPRGTEKMVNVAYMTYASELFSWYAGSVEADTYFCPERHGTYFGGFFLKDMPAMGKRDYNISTSLTGDKGKDFLDALTEGQRRHITPIPDLQRKDLKEIITVRRAISVELRKFLSGGQADKARVIAFGRRYGELDGVLSYRYAMAFSQVSRSLTKQQRAELARLRGLEGFTNTPAYLYSSPMNAAVQLPDTNRFFFPPLNVGQWPDKILLYRRCLEYNQGSHPVIFLKVSIERISLDRIS